MTREQMILFLTRKELDWYVEHHEDWRDDATEFFANGGFNQYTTEELAEEYKITTEN